MVSKRMPVIFVGHGSPMLAIEDNDITRGMEEIGKKVLEEFGKPKAILSISAHWYTSGSLIQTEAEPRQVYDMRGFPEELYALKYPAKGSMELSQAVMDALGDEVTVNNDWGIDHGTWAVLTHMFPDADIPVVQLSVNRYFSAREAYDFSERLSALRDQGFLVIGSGNVVHNLMRVEWDNEGGSRMAEIFNEKIVSAVTVREDDMVLGYKDLEFSVYAAPMPDHFLPLVYILGLSRDEKPYVFNNVCTLGSMGMVGFAFGLS